MAVVLVKELMLVLALCYQTFGDHVLHVSISVNYTPPADFTPSPSQYRAASGSVNITCTATGGTGTMSYQWSSTCRDCPFRTATLNSIVRPAVHSGDSGIHTCTVQRGGQSRSQSITFRVVGAGIHIFKGAVIGSLQVPGSLSNNSLAIFHDDVSGIRLRFICRSDSATENVGQFIGLDGNAITKNNQFFDIDRILPGEVRVQNTVGIQASLPASRQGVYTCRMPLQSGELRDINIGLYPSGFNTPPTILNLDFNLTTKRLSCTSTGSPATTVTWMRDGQPLTIDGTTYQLTQTVISRQSSTYANVLAFNAQVANIMGHTYNCNVTNALGSAAAQGIHVLPVTITVDYTPPPGFALGPNEYRAASGPVIVTCTATGGAEPVSYQWSSTCRDCPFQTAISQSVHRPAVHSGDTGTHTCTVSSTAGPGSASIELRVLGAGIHIFYGDVVGSLQVPGSLPNNSLAIFTDPGLNARMISFLIVCRSDSLVKNVGKLIGLDGNTTITSTSFFTVSNSQAGELKVENSITSQQHYLPSSAQGVYTCRIPLQNGEMRKINVGIYPHGFNRSPIIDNLVFNPTTKRLSCTSTGSPATTVTWMRDGQPLTIDGTTYQLTQTVTNRRTSTYENLLIFNDQLANIMGHNYKCTVVNALGSAVQEIYVLHVSITVDYTPPPGFIPGPNEYRAASGPVTVTCNAIGTSATGPVRHQWSSTCRDCPFRHSASNNIIQHVIYSGDTGIHTCTATDSTGKAGPGSASIEIRTVGAGIHVFRGDAVGSLQVPGSLPSSGNSLAVFSELAHLVILCSSDSEKENVGELIGLDGTSAVTSNSFFHITHHHAGGLKIRNNNSLQYLPSSEQGVYTCRIPLQSGEVRGINVGIYSYGFNIPPTIIDLLFTSGSTSSNLTCTSSGSPATTVTWMRDNQPLIIDGTTYQLTQTVINRAASTYDNVLTINNQLANIFGYSYTCTVTNALGSDSQVLQVFDQELFRIHIGPVEHCITWKPEVARSIERSIHKSLAEAISRQCKCVFLPEYIGSGTFSCRNATTEATYRSKINGTISHNVSQVMNLVQNWVETRPILPVEWWMLSVYPSCPVHIPKSQAYPECQTSWPPSNRTLVISNPQTIQCINTCLHRQHLGACKP